MTDGELDLAGLLDEDEIVTTETETKPTLDAEEENQVEDLMGDMLMDDPAKEASTEMTLEEAEAQPVVTIEEATEEERMIKIEREKFNTFINCVKLVVDSECTDCDIQDGSIRQLSNNKRSIIQVNLAQVLGDMDLSLSMASQKVQLLKSFELDDSVEDEGSVSIEVDDHRIHFKDKFGYVHFSKPMKKMLDNKYMSDDAFDKKVIINDDEKIMEVEIPNYIAKRRIKSICDVVKTDVISVKMNNGKASIDIDSPDIKTTVVKDIPLLKEMPKSKFDILLLPFAMEANSTIKFRVYKIPSGKLLCIFEQTYFKIPVTIYITTQLIK